MKESLLWFIFIVIVLGGSVLGIWFLASLRLSSTRAGQHTGYITAIEQNGWFFPNYVIYVKTDTSSSQEDTYCINRHNKELANKLKEAQTTKEKVTIKFDGVRGFGVDLCFGDEIQSVSF